MKRLLECLRSLWERPDPMAALDSVEHQQAVDLRVAYRQLAEADFEALARIHYVTAGRTCSVCQEAHAIADERVGGELS